MTFVASITVVAGADISMMIPAPQSVTRQTGEMELNSKTKIYFSTRDVPRAMETTLQPLANVLAEDIELLTGHRPPVVDLATEQPTLGSIVLKFQAIDGTFADSEETEDQSYVLEVDDQITLSSRYYKGVAYAAASLLQLISSTPDRDEIPQVTIRDRPLCEYRALMLDVARRPHSIESIQEVVDLCRLFKVRYLQLHLTDDQSFTYPFEPVINGLAERKIRNNHYTRTQMRELVAYADVRGVTLIPEVEFPGHTGMLLKSGYLIDDPEIKGFGHADIASPINAEKVNAIIADVSQIFQTSPYFHIGGDESGARNRLVPFLTRTNRFLRGQAPQQRKRMLVWEGFHGAPTDQLPATGDDRIVVMAWEGGAYNPPWNLLGNGYTIINASWKPLYIVGGGHIRYPHHSTRRWPAETLYGWTHDHFVHWQPGVPIYEDRGPADSDRNDSTWRASFIGKQDQVLGGQLIFWEQHETVVLPEFLERIPAFSTRLWNPSDSRPFKKFREHQDQLTDRIMALIRPVEISPESLDPNSPVSWDYRIYQGDRVTLEMNNRSQVDGEIRYEIAGVNRRLGSFYAKPVKRASKTSRLYGAPIELTRDGFVVRAGLFRSDGTPIRGQSYQIYNNFPQTVRTTSYQRSRDEFPASKREFPDFETFIGKRKVIKSADTPWLRGPWTHTERGLQRLDTVWRVETGGVYQVGSKADSGRATTYVDLNQNGRWEPEEKLISTLPREKESSVEIELDPGDYRVRIDHVTELVRPVLITVITGPDTGQKRKDLSEYLVPLIEHQVDLTPGR